MAWFTSPTKPTQKDKTNKDFFKIFESTLLFLYQIFRAIISPRRFLISILHIREEIYAGRGVSNVTRTSLGRVTGAGIGRMFLTTVRISSQG